MCIEILTVKECWYCAPGGSYTSYSKMTLYLLNISQVRCEKELPSKKKHLAKGRSDQRHLGIKYHGLWRCTYNGD
jgi:hypothetical protein